MMGYARNGCRIAGGSVRVGDTDVLSLTEPQQRALRGRELLARAQRVVGLRDDERVQRRARQLGLPGSSSPRLTWARGRGRGWSRWEGPSCGGGAAARPCCASC